jgi:predicted transcriptional regulator of viral defense system
MTLRNEGDSISIEIGTVRQWREAGLGTAAFRSLVRAGELKRYRQGVYVRAAYLAAAESAPSTRHALRAAAAIASQTTRKAAASHQSAALIHGLDLLRAPNPEMVSLTCRPGGYRGRSSSGVLVHSAQLPRNHVMRRHGVWVTTATRTVVDLARSLSFMEGVVLADSALRLGKTTDFGLADMLRACARWPGIERARSVVQFSDELAESVLESCARVVFDQAGLPPPVLQAAIVSTDGEFVGRVDFYWPDYQTIAEADGMAKYDDPSRARREVKRDIRLRDAGNKVVHFTWDELFSQRGRVIGRVRTAFKAPTPY